MARRVYFIVLLLVLGVNVKAQLNSAELPAGYYVVVAAYAPSREDLARHYTEELVRSGITAFCGFNSAKNYFFVYLNYFQDLKEALRSMRVTRREPEFAQAWVRVVSGETSSLALLLRGEGNNTSTGKSTVIKEEPNRRTLLSEEKADLQELAKEEKTAPSNKPETSSLLPPADTVAAIDKRPVRQNDSLTLDNKKVFLSLFNAVNLRNVDGTVKIIDTERSRLLREVKGNEYVTLPAPKSDSGRLTMICEAFGYRKVQQEINYPLLPTDTAYEHVERVDTTLVISFDLVRYRRGDIVTLYHVYFYNDAALMLPESRYELNTLLQMMQENPKYRIQLHGHTNGNYRGRIITVGEGRNYFSLTGSKESLGSAKELSYNRAEVIKEYLQANGIEPSRVEVKAWGGRRPIHDRHSVNAKKNVRVEVEILED